ncbi:MAG: dethiobiotin synthase [Gammaproteobacteria bacterium]
MKRAAYFVTGTDTEVGKTLCTAAWLRVARLQGLRTVGMKPIASGCVATPAGLRNEDALAHLGESSAPQPDYAAINPHAFAPAIAPHIAAAEAGVRIDPERLCRQWQALTADRDFALMEGAGGWLVPLDEAHFFPVLATRLQLPVLLVVGLRLGCINHALLTAEAIAARGLRLAGWVGNRIDPGFSRLEDNLAALHRHLPAPCLGVVPPLPQPVLADRVAAAASCLRLPEGAA